MSGLTNITDTGAARDGPRDLVEGLRALMARSVVADVPDDAYAEALAHVEAAHAALAGPSLERGRRVNLGRAQIARTRAGSPWRVFAHNPLGIPQDITVADGRAHSVVEPSALLEGPPGILHGGFAAALLDAHLSTLVQVQGIRAVTVRIDVSFLAPAPLDAPFELEGVIDRIEGRKVHASGTVRRRGEEIARAEALLIVVPGEPD